MVVLGITAVIAGAVIFLVSRPSTRNISSLVVRFGHAFPNPNPAPGAPEGDPVGDALAVALGTATIGPRDPTNPIVYEAEAYLGMSRDRRPVYAYVGSLQPELGKIGLVIRREWLTTQGHGVTGCDTGGLYGRIKGFSHGPKGGEREAMTRLTHGPAGWEPRFSDEVRAAHGKWESYVRGRAPNCEALDEYLKTCIEAETKALNGKLPDRRLWTWEVREFAHITSGDLHAIVLTEEAHKDFDDRRRALGDDSMPPHIDLVPCSIDPASGLSHFDEDAVVQLFVTAGSAND